MKRTLLIICISFLISPLFAQTDFGLKAGANFSNLNFSNKKYSTSFILGVHAGAFYNYNIAEKAAIQGELLFSTEGNKWKTTSTTARVNETQVRIPILLQYHLAENIYAEAGPQYSLLLAISQTRDGEEKENIKEYYKTGTFGFGIGAGYMFTGNLEGLRAGLRYNGDFSKINSEDVGGNDLKNRVIQLSFMYSFPKK